MRAASQLLALLISEAIVVGLAVTGGGILSSILLKQSPRGGCLILAGFGWWEEREGNVFVIYVRGAVSNIGVDEVNITGVWVAINGVNYNLRFTANAIKPNEWTEVFC